MKLNLNGEVLALSLLSAGESAHAFSAFLPSRFTIKNWVLCAEDGKELEENIANLRSGYKPALLFGMGLGAVVSIIAKSPIPILFAGGSSLLMLQLYEGALPKELRLRNPMDIFLPEPPPKNGNGNGAALSTVLPATGLVASLGI